MMTNMVILTPPLKESLVCVRSFSGNVDLCIVFYYVNFFGFSLLTSTHVPSGFVLLAFYPIIIHPIIIRKQFIALGSSPDFKQGYTVGVSTKTVKVKGQDRTSHTSRHTARSLTATCTTWLTFEACIISAC